jgi:hypothetical protein
MEAYESLVTELQLTEPTNTPPLLPPYDETDMFDEQFNKAHLSLQRNIRLKDRILALIDAYFLGKLLNEIVDRTVRSGYNRKLTDHYRRIAEKTYDIFEYNPDQIQRTQTIDVQQIQKISRPKAKTLQGIVLVSLAGART